MAAVAAVVRGAAIAERAEEADEGAVAVAVVSGGAVTVWAGHAGPLVTRFFLQVLLVGGGAGAQEDVADLELGLAEAGVRGGAEEEVRDLEELEGRGVGDGLGQLLDFGFRYGGGYILHKAFSESGSGFLVEERPSSAAGPAGETTHLETPSCRPRLLQRLVRPG